MPGPVMVLAKHTPTQPVPGPYRVLWLVDSQVIGTSMQGDRSRGSIDMEHSGTPGEEATLTALRRGIHDH